MKKVTLSGSVKIDDRRLRVRDLSSRMSAVTTTELTTSRSQMRQSLNFQT